MRQIAKLLFGSLIVLALFGGYMTVFAAKNFQQNFQWTFNDYSFTVNGTDTPAQPTIQFNVDEAMSPLKWTYQVVNNGNIPITIAATAVADGATATWNQASKLLQVGDSFTFELTLSDFTKAGTCTISFTKATT